MRRSLDLQRHGARELWRFSKPIGLGTGACVRRGSLASHETESQVVNRNLLAAKLADLADRRTRVVAQQAESPEALAANRDKLDLASFNLMLCVQCCADIASHLIADEGWAAATSISEAFARLQEHQVVSAQTAAALKKAVGLRNLVAHGYGHMDPRIVHAAATSGLVDIDTFAREVAKWVHMERADTPV